MANSGYLADAVDRLTMTTRQVDTEPGQRRVAQRLSAASTTPSGSSSPSVGPRWSPVETVSRLFTGANRIRLAAYTLARLPTLPPADGQPELESVAVAGAVLRDSYALEPPLVPGVRRGPGPPA